MTNQLYYKNLALTSSLILVFGSIIDFPDNTVNAILDLLLSLIALATTIFAFLWLKKKIMIPGVIIYTLYFNYKLFTNSLTHIGDEMLAAEPDSFVVKLNILALVFVLAGLFDSFTGDKFFKRNSNLGLIQLTIMVVLICFICQFGVRSLG